MKRSSQFSIALTMALLVLVACSSGDNSTHPKKKNSVVEPVVLVHPLSGRNAESGKVLVVKVDDTEPAHPQIGLKDADVIYVEQVEGGLTRLAAVFSSALPVAIGPVRSARISDIDIFAAYGKVAFAYSGAQHKLLPVIGEANMVNLGAQRMSARYYSRDKNRDAPVNLILDPRLLMQDHGQDATSAISVGWNFGSNSVKTETATVVEAHWPASWYRATWSSGENRWLLEHDGDPDVDANGYVLGPTTLIVQLVDIHPSEYFDKGGGNTPKSETVGTGSALILQKGSVYRALWDRPSLQSQTRFRLDPGVYGKDEEIKMTPGQVWVWLVDRNRPPKLNPETSG